MKFGSVENPEGIDFSLPSDDRGTENVLKLAEGGDFRAFVGCSKWNKNDLKGFFPRGVKNELEYYSSQFNSIELNALAYGRKPANVIQNWYDSTPSEFRFFSKFSQSISHYRRLNNTEEFVENFIGGLDNLGEKLGGLFLQLNSNFSPKDVERVFRFIEFYRWEIPLSIEFRHTDWYNDLEIALPLYELFEEADVSTVIVDSAGRRDLIHMRLTTPRAFIRFVGNNHPTDFERLDEWIDRIAKWKKLGLRELDFFVHQNFEKKPAMLAAYFIEGLNRELKTNLQVPQMAS